VLGRLLKEERKHVLMFFVERDLYLPGRVAFIIGLFSFHKFLSLLFSDCGVENI
jgi:hypothetical protein